MALEFSWNGDQILEENFFSKDEAVFTKGSQNADLFSLFSVVQYYLWLNNSLSIIINKVWFWGFFAYTEPCFLK